MFKYFSDKIIICNLYQLMIIIIILCTYIFTVDVLCSNTPSEMNMDIRKFIISNPIQ